MARSIRDDIRESEDYEPSFCSERELRYSKMYKCKNCPYSNNMAAGGCALKDESYQFEKELEDEDY